VNYSQQVEPWPSMNVNPNSWREIGLGSASSGKEGGEQALLEVMLKQPAKFCALIAQLIPQHFKFEHEHTVMALSSEEVRLRLAEVRGKLLDAGIDLEALPVVEALPIEVWRRLTQASDHPGTRLSPLRWTSLLHFPTVL
jgi:hypothetical protein